MDYLTRQLLLLYAKLTESLQDQKNSVSAIQKNNDKHQQVCEKQIENFFSLYKKSESDKEISSNRQTSIQNSIRWATWLAAFGAIIYAGITYGQWNTAKEIYEAQTRPWVGITGVKLVDQQPDIWSFNVALQNYGNSPAINVYVWPDSRTGGVGYLKEWGKVAEGLCKDADTAIGDSRALTKIIFPKQEFIDEGGPHSGRVNRSTRNWLTVCVTYEGSSGEKYRTLSLFEPIPQSTPENGFIPTDHFKITEARAY
jgi:hypothetical protein